MNDVLALAAYLALPLIGIGVWRIEAVRRLDLAARLAIATAAGALITGGVMTILSITHLPWSRTLLVIILGAVSIATWPRRRIFPATGNWQPATLAFLLLTLYGLLTARETCGDLNFFWGPKAVHFYRHGGIALADLSDRMNPGYPLLVPLLYAWSNTLAAQFSWWAALLSTALFLFAAVAVVRGTSGDARGALLVAAVLSYAMALAMGAGAGEPPLVLFETLAVCAITFIDSPLLASIGLAGAAMTKIEGATFVIAVVIADLVLRRDWKRTLSMAAPAALLLAAWLGYVRVNHLAEYYRGAAMPIYPATLPSVLATLAKAASYELWGLPWLVPIVALAMGNIRRALFPLLVALLTFGAAIFFYIHLPDPTWWILSSAPRVLLTPLAALLIAAVAAWYSPAAHGLVPQGEKA